MATRTVAVVLAGGVGERMGAGRPKQLMEIGGRPILARAIAAFDAHPGIGEVVVVMAAAICARPPPSPRRSARRRR